MEPGDITVAQMAVPHLLVHDELHDRVPVIVAPPVAAVIGLAFLIPHDGVDDLAVIQNKIDMVSDLAKGGRACDHIPAVHQR